MKIKASFTRNQKLIIIECEKYCVPNFIPNGAHVLPTTRNLNQRYEKLAKPFPSNFELGFTTKNIRGTRIIRFDIAVVPTMQRNRCLLGRRARSNTHRGCTEKGCDIGSTRRRESHTCGCCCAKAISQRGEIRVYATHPEERRDIETQRYERRS